MAGSHWNQMLRDQFTWHWRCFTTIAWRLGHVIVGVLAMRNASHFGRETVYYHTFDYAATAQEALSQLDDEIATWLDGVEALGEDGLERPCGDAEGPFGEDPMSRLVLHIHRELLHHLAEVCLLRDLCLHTQGARLRSGSSQSGARVGTAS